MARYIDADKADVERISCFYGVECRLEDVQEWLDEQPTIDVVEIVSDKQSTTTMCYYVIKHLITGLYYRGKGDNRWGKYYNQASVYRIKGQVDSVVNQLNRKGEQVKAVPIHIIEIE